MVETGSNDSETLYEVDKYMCWVDDVGFAKIVLKHRNSDGMWEWEVDSWLLRPQKLYYYIGCSNLLYGDQDEALVNAIGTYDGIVTNLWNWNNGSYNDQQMLLIGFAEEEYEKPTVLSEY